jgi:transposase
MTANKLNSQRQTLVHFWNNGVRSQKELHKITNIPLSTIKYNIQKLKKTGDVAHRRSNGRSKKIGSRESRDLERYIRKDSSLSLRTLATKLSNNGVEVSHVTVGARLKELGYKNGLPNGTPMLTAVQKAKRVEWATNHLNDQWEKTLFSDETAFQLFRNTISQWYKGPRPIRPLPKNRQKIFAWGGFCARGKTTLHCFTGIMNAKFYIDILQQHLPEVRRMFGRRWRFQQDNDPKHTSRVAREFLEENFPEVMDWPSNSPDLNPIENLWGIVKHRVEKRMPNNIGELQQYMTEEWENIPDEFLTNLIRSMHNRCQLVIDSNGEPINY